MAPRPARARCARSSMIPGEETGFCRLEEVEGTDNGNDQGLLYVYEKQQTLVDVMWS